MPPAVFCADGSPFAIPRVSGCCFSLRFCSFSVAGISPNDFVSLWFVSSGCAFSLGIYSSSCFFVVFFAPASVPPQPVCLALFCVALWFPGASDSLGSPVPVATWFPFGTSQGCFNLCHLDFVMTTCGGIPSVLSQLCSSASFVSCVLLVTYSPLGLRLASLGALSG